MLFNRTAKSIVLGGCAALLGVAIFAVATPQATAEVGLPVYSGGIEEPVPAGFSSWDQLFEMQGRMNAAATAVTQAAASLPDSGLGSVVAAPENGRVEVYWHGDVPRAVQAVIEEQRVNVPVAVLPARFSQADLISDASALAKNPDVLEVGPAPDASGLTARVRNGRTAAVQQEISRSGLATAVTIDSETSPAVFLSRQNDTAPWYAGARTKMGGSRCTLNFPINHGGRTKLLYAAHCLSSGNEVDSTGEVIGPVTYRVVSRDTSILDGRGWGRMWDGPWNETSYTKPVQGATYSYVGNWLCTSGAVSGVRCGIQVIANNQTIGGIFPQIVAKQVNGLNAAGQGDSGGPVFELPSPDNGKVIAKGSISQGIPGYTTTCTGEPIARTCYKRFAYADVTEALSYYGATIVTS